MIDLVSLNGYFSEVTSNKEKERADNEAQKARNALDSLKKMQGLIVAEKEKVITAELNAKKSNELAIQQQRFNDTLAVKLIAIQNLQAENLKLADERLEMAGNLIRKEKKIRRFRTLKNTAIGLALGAVLILLLK